MIKLSFLAQAFCVGSLLVTPAASAVLNETKEEFVARMQTSMQNLFDIQYPPFSTQAWWLGLNDPDYGELYFVFGYAGKTPNATKYADIPASLDQNFNIGSISKTFGATVNILLAEQGVFALNDTVADLVPEIAAQQFPEYANNTLTELMSMRTLVPDFLNDPDGLLAEIVGDPTVRFTLAEIIEFAMARYPADPSDPETCPDGCGQYSTTNILMAELITETITGRSFSNLVRELVLEPLNLTRTALPLRNSTGDRPDPAATPYAMSGCVSEFTDNGANITEGDDQTILENAIVQVSSGGAMYSTIQDLLHWAMTGVGDDLLSAESLKARKDYRLIKEGLLYGLGQYEFFVAKDDESSAFFRGWYGHVGDSFGFETLAFKHDGLNASFASAVNTCNYAGVMVQALQVFTDELNARAASTVTDMPSTTPAPTTSGGTPAMPTTESTSSGSQPFGSYGHGLAALVSLAVITVSLLF